MKPSKEDYAWRRYIIFRKEGFSVEQSTNNVLLEMYNLSKKSEKPYVAESLQDIILLMREH